jgi:hypothetical protein
VKQGVNLGLKQNQHADAPAGVGKLPIASDTWNACAPAAWRHLF